MKETLKKQYAHLWRTYKRVICDFNKEVWRNGGFGLTRPDRLAYHILESTRFYSEGEEIPGSAQDYGAEDLLPLLSEIRKEVEKWIDHTELEAVNEKFPWTGGNQFSVILFLLRHSQFHLGELNALLNDQYKGEAPDFFVNSDS